ncbi:MAG: hypothetical protein KF832_00235 [Caldilineaceae bacterium]|nr:hypothetical protein [Caldilineaceae bacterium]
MFRTRVQLPPSPPYKNDLDFIQVIFILTANLPKRSIDKPHKNIYNSIIMLLNASLDTSFWNRAADVGITAYLFSFFRVYYCRVVKDEIITTDPNETALIYPQAMLFTVFEEDGRLQQAEPQNTLSLYGLGEAAAIALAREQQWILLINDQRPLLFAESLEIHCVCVPDFCVFLYSQGKVTAAAAEGYLERLRPTTGKQLIVRAQEVLKRVREQRGE